MTELLKSAEIVINGQIAEVIEIKNPCQMWRNLDAWFEKHGDDAEIRIRRADDTLYKDFKIVVSKNGHRQKVNSVKETNRWMMLKAAGKVVTKKDLKAKAEAKKAKKREYDKARRVRLKAARLAAANNQPEVKEAI